MEDALTKETLTGWLDDGGTLSPIPEHAQPQGNIRIVVDRRVYERKRQHEDGTWIYVYQMTEPA
jgi:hypothetical protein